MFQFMAPTWPSDGPKHSLPASEIEKFRARHRRFCRGQQQTATPNARIEALDVDEGRTRKISAKWRQKQQQTQHRNQFDDGYWPKSAGTEMHLGFNAFDFSASPEAFNDDAEEFATIIETNQQGDEELYKDQPEQSVEAELGSVDTDEQQQRKQHMADVAKQVTSMGFNSVRLWEQRLPGIRYPGGSIQQLRTFNPNSMWGAPMHYAMSLYYQPQHYA